MKELSEKSEKRGFASDGSGDAAVGSARLVPFRTLAQTSPVAPSACVGKRFSAVQIIWNRSTRARTLVFRRQYPMKSRHVNFEFAFFPSPRKFSSPRDIEKLNY